MDGQGWWSGVVTCGELTFRNIFNRFIPLFDSTRSLTDKILNVHCQNACLSFSLFIYLLVIVFTARCRRQNAVKRLKQRFVEPKVRELAAVAQELCHDIMKGCDC